MVGSVYVDRKGKEWKIERKTVLRNGQALFLYRLIKKDSVFLTKWFTNEGLWEFIYKAKWVRKYDVNELSVCSNDNIDNVSGKGD